ncbi:MAG: N-acetyltransferase [Rhodospirillaceae bacterium]|jgi:predicted N-acetyltransferase YhbS|nr:N-acetyltransferase [Rhodospirillaceae bacterium]MBT5013031.1 N-acetyltransferase [Rhodospirillaceae bacterium]MBT7356859.1 N-acetyltransferase [Rhodospirillaceae bacterium]
MITIAEQLPEDIGAIDRILDKAFGPAREDKTSYAYRLGIQPTDDLSFVARDEDGIVGTLRFWPVYIGNDAISALLLGPLGVAPKRQNAGIGKALMNHGHRAAKKLGHSAVLLVGDRDYYKNFGYSSASAHAIIMPGEGPSRLLCRELTPGALDGVNGTIMRADAVHVISSRQDRA